MIATTANSSKSNTLFLNVFYITFIVISHFGCAKMPSYTNYPSEKITVGPGPEDMVLDTLFDKSNPRFLVSCAARRKSETPHGEIWTVDLKTEKTSILPRKGEPEEYGFRPHGIDLVKRPDGSIRLFAINHQDDKERQFIMEYQVFNDHLQFIAAYENPILSTPNDVCFDPQGGFYWSNDASSRKKAFIEPIFGIKGGYVGHRKNDDTWEKSAQKFAYTNGIIVLNDDLYISTVIQGKVFRFAKKDMQAKPEVIAKVVGGDNITSTANDNLLVTAHLRQIRFLRHMKNPNVKSPSVVYLINPTTKETKVVFADSGENISTASTAIWYNNYLYICQVFDGFILKAKTGTL